MGSCLSAKLYWSSSGESGSTHFAVDDDLKNVIRKRPELKEIADVFLNSIVPRIKRSLSDIDRGVDLTRSDVVCTIRTALVIYQHEKNKELQAAPNCQTGYHLFSLTKKPRKTSSRKNLYEDTVAELSKLNFPELAADELQPFIGDLKDFTGKLRQQKQKIEERLRSRRRWRKVWSVALNAAVVGMLIASVLLVAAVPALGAATAMKSTVEPLVSSILKDKEKALEEEKKTVEMMREGKNSLEHSLESVRLLAENVAVGIASLVDCVKMAGEAPEEVAMEELAKKIGEVEGSLVELKNKVRSCHDKLERSVSKFLEAIRN